MLREHATWSWRERLFFLTGLMEGEGSFMFTQRCPRLVVAMTDRDVIYRFGDLTGATVLGPYNHRIAAGGGSPRRPVWQARLCGADAAGWMMMLYPFMGQRRRAKIREVLAAWKAVPTIKRRKDGRHS